MQIRKVARLGTGHTPSRSVEAYWDPVACTIPWLTLADVWQLRDGSVSVVHDTKERISPLGLANSAAVRHPAGTVAFSRTASVGFSCILGVEMATSQDFVTWTCGPKLDPRYLLWALRGERDDILRRTQGSTHKTIYMPDLEQLTIPFPPLDAQRRIASYLDSETARIDEVVRMKERLLDQIHRRQQASLDESLVPEALGGVADQSTPSRWKVSSLRRVAAFFTDGDWIESPYITPDGIRLIQTGNVQAGEYREQGYRYIAPQTFASLGCTEVFPGDVLISRLASPVGCACIAPDLGVRMIASVDVVILRPTRLMEPEFLVRYLTTARHLGVADLLARGTTMQRLSRSQLGDIVVPVPPLEVQRHLVDKLKVGEAPIAAVRERIERQVALLREHRRSLATLAVTGEGRAA